jgi:hypothetical protein
VFPLTTWLVLAANLESVRARRGEVLTRQGERAVSFLIIASGHVEVRHIGSDGVTTVAKLSPGLRDRVKIRSVVTGVSGAARCNSIRRGSRGV